jgi:phage/plasmid-like protein (TIGR03299 family)
MAHNLNINALTGKVSFASAIQKAWHGLGQILPGRMTAEEAIQEAGLNYEVKKLPLFTDLGIGDLQDIDTHFATVRTDTKKVLGVVGNKYEVLQNSECFTFFDSIVDKGSAIYETAGALGDGERIFITAKLPDDLIIGDDVIEQYLFLTSSHDGTGAITAAFTPTRIVCANTLRIALANNTRSISIKHTRNIKGQLYQAAELMNIVTKKSQQVEDLFNRMAKVQISEHTLQMLLTDTFRPETAPKAEELSSFTSKRVEEVMEYAHSHDTQLTRETKGTVYGFVNAVTGYFQNVKSYKTPENKLTSIIEGRANTYGERAFELAATFINN